MIGKSLPGARVGSHLWHSGEASFRRRRREPQDVASQMHDAQVMRRVEQQASGLHAGADLESGSDSGLESIIDSKFPCSIVWTPIHPITCLLPFVGHMGICDSMGRLHDWGGGPIHPTAPKFMLFGEPARYIRFHPVDKQAWDEAIDQADRDYLNKMHCMIFGSDCHSHVARVLDILRIGGCTCHNKVAIAAAMFFCGRHTSLRGFLSTWMGFSIVLIIMFIKRSID